MLQSDRRHGKHSDCGAYRINKIEGYGESKPGIADLEDIIHPLLVGTILPNMIPGQIGSTHVVFEGAQRLDLPPVRFLERWPKQKTFHATVIECCGHTAARGV